MEQCLKILLFFNSKCRAFPEPGKVAQFHRIESDGVNDNVKKLVCIDKVLKVKENLSANINAATFP